MKLCCVTVLPTRLKVMRQCFQARDSYFGLGLFQVRYNQAGWWPQHLEEPTCIIAGGRKGGREGRQCQLTESTDLVSVTGLPTVTLIG